MYFYIYESSKVSQTNRELWAPFIDRRIKKEVSMIARIKHQKSRKRKYYRLLNFHIEPELDSCISRAADREGITVSDFIRTACLRALEEAHTIEDRDKNL
jgi:hypothetical protein